jgi:hypothetical protein
MLYLKPRHWVSLVVCSLLRLWWLNDKFWFLLPNFSVSQLQGIGKGSNNIKSSLTRNMGKINSKGFLTSLIIEQFTFKWG